jgi:anti-anti-sigma factor
VGEQSPRAGDEENGETKMSQTSGPTRESIETYEFQVSTRVTAGVAVITVAGRLEPSTMPTCRSALDAILRLRAPQIVVDLSRAELDPESIAMLTWMRHYVGHFGVTLTLTGVSRVVRRILEREHLDSVFRVRPTDHAQRMATARADHRDQWPGVHRQSPLQAGGPAQQGHTQTSGERIRLVQR